MKYLEYAKHVNGNEYVLRWVETTLGNYLEKNNPPTEEVEHIIDYLAQETKRISQMSYPEAKRNAEKWTKALQKKGELIKEKKTDTEVVLDFKDGFKVVKLIGDAAYKREGFLMRSCVASYYGKPTEIYSLRDKNNMPHCTMEKDRQIKGKGNGDIHPKYVGYVVKFLKHIGMTVGDSEMAHLGYVNIKEIQKKEPDITFPELYAGKYFWKENLSKVKDKDRMSLWGIFGLFTFTHKLEIKYNFDINKSVFRLKNKLSKIKNKGGSNEVAMADYNEVAMADSNKVAMAYSNEVAMANYNEVAMADSNEVAMANYNEVAMANYNKVAMADSNRVAMASSNEIKSGAANVFAGCAGNKIETGKNSVVVMGEESLVKGKKGSLIVLYERDGLGNIINHVSVIVDGEKIKEDTWYMLVDGKFNEVESDIEL